MSNKKNARLKCIIVCLLAQHVNSSNIFNGECSYLHNVCQWCVEDKKYRIADLTLKSNVKVKYTKHLFVWFEMQTPLQYSIFNGGVSYFVHRLHVTCR